jgi:hypothetical protein
MQELVVRGAAAGPDHARPRSEQRAGADRHETVRRVRVADAERAAQAIAQPPGGALDLRCDLGQPGRRLTDHHDPRRRAEVVRQWRQVAQRQSDRRRHGCHRPRESKTKTSGQSAKLAVKVGETKGLSRSGYVEQERVLRSRRARR